MEAPDFIQQIREGMKRKGLNQEALAELVGATQSHISHMLRGVRKPSSDMVKALAGALALDVNAMLLSAGFAPTSPVAVSPDAESIARFWENAERDAKSRLAAAQTDAERDAILDELGTIKANRRGVIDFQEARAVALAAAEEDAPQAPVARRPPRKRPPEFQDVEIRGNIAAGKPKPIGEQRIGQGDSD